MTDQSSLPLSWDDPALLWPKEARRRARYRALQSWYRDQVLRAQPGIHPSKRPLGSLLDRQSTDQGRNFLHPAIDAYVKDRVKIVKKEGGTISTPRLRSNMLSSMPLCFNIFGYLREHPPALAVAAELLGRALNLHIDHVDRIEVEFAPQPIEKYLGDHTAFDAYVEYRSGSKRGFLGIETKYTEPFSPKVHDDNENYERLTSSVYGFPKEGAFDRLKLQATNQLWRNSLLAIALRSDEKSGFNEAHVVVLSAQEDRAAIKALERLSAERGPDDDLVLSATLESLFDVCSGYTETEDWAREFRRRYLDLDPVRASTRLKNLF